jgi:hypothetical protein
MNRFPRKFSTLFVAGVLLSAACCSFGFAQSSEGSAPAPVVVAKIAVKVSSRNAKVGDLIAAKTLRAYKLQDWTDIPKGSKILGKVATVQNRKDGNGDSLMTFRFDQIEVKGGSPVTIRGLVVAIGPEMSPHDLFGANSVMARNINPQSGTGPTSGSQGTGSSNGLDPNTGLGSAGAKDEDDIRLGSTLPGVSLGKHMDADWTTMLKGFKSEIDLDPEVVVKVQLK